MKFLKVLKGHFWSHGVDEPIQFLADKLGVNPETIRVYCRQADNGVGTGSDQLSPTVVSWLKDQSFAVMTQMESFNPVSKFFDDMEREK